MATLTELETAGELYRLDPGLPSDRQNLRIVHASPRFRRWAGETLPGLTSQWTSELSPTEQLVTLVESFCAGEEMEVGSRFHVLTPAVNGVWELKTPDLRIFGWFYVKDCFVATVADAADRVKKYGLYAGYIGDVVRFRAALNLDPPTFVLGGPHDVVSNYHYP